MKIRTILAAAAVTLAAVSSFAVPIEYLDWLQGPVQFLMTKEEAAKAKGITKDEEAAGFVALFWARRDPTPGTPRNEFREEFARRVAYADKNLAAAERMRGSMTDRGMIWVLYGPPKRMERSSSEMTPGYDASGNLQKDERSSDNWMQWIYEGDEAKSVFRVPRATIRFVDRMNTNEYKIERGLQPLAPGGGTIGSGTGATPSVSIDLVGSRERLIARSITQPALTAAPVFDMPAEPEPAPAAPAVVTDLSTESLAAAVAQFKAAAKNPFEKHVHVSWGEFVTSQGDVFAPVMLYVPKTAGLTSDQSLTFFGVVQDENGKNVAAFEQPVKLVASRDDFFADTSLDLPGGKLRGIFGLAENGKPLAMTSAELELAGNLDKDATAVSPLILSNNIYPLTEAQAPTEPFAFGGVKVVPKADGIFRTSDELWYFFELRNPGLPDVAASTDAGTVVLTEVAEPVSPKIQVKIDIEGTDATGKKVKKTAPPAEVAAVQMKGVPGHYGVGNAFPLTSFRPGSYTLTAKVIDTVNKKSYTLSDEFRVVE